MLKFKFGKLVRDKIIDQQIESGAVPHYRVLSRQEHIQALVDKITEEATEIMDAPPSEVAGEIADIQQIVDDLVTILGHAPETIRTEMDKKADKAGAFQRGLYVDYVEIDNDNAWLPYYRKHSDRYPEISDQGR